MRILFYLFIILNISLSAQNTTPSQGKQKCYAKANLVDSTSGKTPTVFLINGNETYYLTDSYVCKCNPKEVRLTIVRGKRPLGVFFTPGRFTSAQIRALTVGFQLQPGDRIMISLERAASGSSPCLVLSTSPIFVLEVK